MEWYVNGGTVGLQAYVKAYGVTPIELAKSLARHPKFYASLTDVRQRITPYQAEIVRAARHLLALVPMLLDVPIYFFVGATGHGATVKELGAGRGEQAMGVLAHVAQIQCQGLDRYRLVYRERARGSHLAYAIREGGADFLSQLACGRLRARHRYFEEHEAALWREFSKLLYEPAGASQGWFSGWSEHPDRPPQLGYAIGWSICKRFHQGALDKQVALREILCAADLEDFERIAAPYRQEFA